MMMIVIVQSEHMQTSQVKAKFINKNATKRPKFYIFMDYVAGYTFCHGLLYRCAPIMTRLGSKVTQESQG